MKKPIQVLLVEDNCTTRALLRAFFAQTDGLEVCGEAGDGWEAMELLETKKPDLMLLDLVMPGLDGMGLLEAMRGRHDFPAPKIIVHSGIGSDEFVQRACRLGASYYLMKPAKLGELAYRIAALFPETRVEPHEDGLCTWTLHRLGARQEMRGFSFLCRGAQLLAQDGRLQLKEVYLQVAKEFDTSYGCVEKNLRTSIRQIHSVASEGYIAAFGGARPPKNGEFLHWLAGELKHEE